MSIRLLAPALALAGAFAPAFDPAQVSVTPAGQATFDFTRRPGEVGLATFSWSVNGHEGSRRITRLLF